MNYILDMYQKTAQKEFEDYMNYLYDLEEIGLITDEQLSELNSFRGRKRKDILITR